MGGERGGVPIQDIAMEELYLHCMQYGDPVNSLTCFTILILGYAKRSLSLVASEWVI